MTERRIEQACVHARRAANCYDAAFTTSMLAFVLALAGILSVVVRLLWLGGAFIVLHVVMMAVSHHFDDERRKHIALMCASVEEEQENP